MTNSTDFEFIVVGSGAGGGTLAARLAESGRRVLLLEAGGDPRVMQGGDPVEPNANRLPDDYDVPVYHAFASENDAMKWDFWVRHYGDDALQKRDPKHREIDGEPAILYPRAGCLGGCTAHNAQITVYPHNADWEFLETLTSDSSWAPERMRKYFQRLENCHHRPPWRWLAKLTGINPTRHGFGGWLQTEFPVDRIFKTVIKDEELLKTVIGSAVEAVEDVGQKKRRVRWFFEALGDPNDWRLVRQNSVGLRYPPLATRNSHRTGTRDRVLDVAKRYPENLTIRLNCLVTRVLFDGTRAVGVEYQQGEKLYRAHHQPSGAPGVTREVHASREVILAGGAFNSPQLLMLSGIGPRQHLEEHGIPVLLDLPGVGSNMQDRYEVGIVNRMNFPNWEVLEGAKFTKDDPQYALWNQARPQGVYTTNGAVLAVIKRSVPERPLPDLFCFALLSKFKGYFPGYSKLFPENLNVLTWAILKAHTNNTAGVVRLRSADPRDTPYINFKYFDEGNDTRGDDVKSVVEGIKFVRELTQPLKKKGVILEEELPGDGVQTDEQLSEFVKDRAWGHHASCTCPIGPRERNGVVNGDFEVHGTQGLRIVDASVFPKIPGFFIVSSIYMIGEKAADVILQKAAGS